MRQDICNSWNVCILYNILFSICKLLCKCLMHKTAITVSFLTLLLFLPVSAMAQITNSTTITFPWDTKLDNPLYVIIITEPTISDEKIDVVKSVVLSEKSFTIDGKKFYAGWKGALNDAALTSTKYAMPTNLEIVTSAQNQEVITITLTSSINKIGYSGYTRYVENNHKIINSNITIYDIDSLTSEELGGIVRHEFGHALGLGHCTAPGDLMNEKISSRLPYISESNLHAITALYDGNIMTRYFEGQQT